MLRGAALSRVLLQKFGRTWGDVPRHRAAGTKYSRALIPYDGVYRVETFSVPREAMHEAVINAVIHRDYADPVPIQVRVYDDRIMLWNPAHLPADWSVERLTGGHASRSHNPGVAYALFRARMIEAWVRGIRRITTVCAAAGNPSPGGGSNPAAACGWSSGIPPPTGQPILTPVTRVTGWSQTL